MPDTRDERGGDEAAMLIAIRRRALTASTYAEWRQVARDVETLAEQLAAANARAKKAERQRGIATSLSNRRKVERNQARLLMYRIIGAIEHAYALNTYVELEPGEEAPTIEALWAEVRQIRGVAADALVGTEGNSSPRTLPSGPATEYRYVLADGRESEFELHNKGPCGCRREQRPVYVGDWRPAPDVTSVDWTDAGDGWSSRQPDASLDGLRGPFTGLLGPLGIDADLVPDGHAEDAALPVADCPSPYRDGTCRHLTCGRCKQHTNNSNQGHYWAWCRVTKTKREFHFCCPGNCELGNDDTTEE